MNIAMTLPTDRQVGATKRIETTETELSSAIRAELIDWASQYECGQAAKLDGPFVARCVLARLSGRPN